MATSYNNFKSTTVRGEFRNSAYPDNSVQPMAYFDGSMNLVGSLIDASGNIIPNNKLKQLQGNLITLADIRGANNIFTGINDFSGNIVSCNIAPTTGNHLCNKTYVDATVAGSSVLLGTNNLWTGTNAFNTFCPATSIAPSGVNDLCNKAYVDTKTTLATVLSNNGAYTGLNTYNTNLPTSTITPTTDNQFTRKGYVDTQVATKASIAQVEASGLTLAGAVSFTNINPPACAVAPTGVNSLCNKTYVDTKTTLATVLSNNSAYTGTNTYNTNLPTSTITPTTDDQLCRKGYVDTQVATKASIAQVEASGLTLAGAVVFTNATPPACAIAPTGVNSLTNKTYVDGQIATRPTTADILTGTNTFTAVNTFSSTLLCNNFRGVNAGDAVALFGTTTTGTINMLANASFSGNFNLCQNHSGGLGIGTQHTGVVNIATGASATATVNIGRAVGSNLVNIGAWTFTGNNLEFPANFTTPSVGQLGHSVSTVGNLNQNLTTDTWLNIATISLGVGVWILTGSMNMSKQAAGATGTTISEILFGLSDTINTVDTINYYSAQYDSMAVAHQRAFAANNTRWFILTATTTLYLNIKCIFTIGTGINMRVNDCEIDAVRVA